jgi:1,4-alpha-glucan branching enzyme
MRIGVATWEYPPKHTGGLGRHVGGLTQALARMGHEVFVFIPKRNAPAFVEGINLVKVSSKKKGFTWIREVNERIVHKALELSLDVFHAQDWITFPSAVELRTYNRFPIVCSIHSTEHDRAGRVLEQKNYALELEEQALKVCNAVITVSDYMKNQLVGLLGISEGRVSVIPNGIDLEGFDVKGAGKNILFIGRLTEQKGVEYLLYALKDYDFDGKIVVLGDGHLKVALSKFAESLGMGGRVEFTGFVSDDDEIRRHLGEARVLVMPSVREPFGIVALEGAGAKVPLILSKGAGVSEFFSDGVNALVVDPSKPKDVVKRIKQLEDENLRGKLVKNAFALVSSDVFSWSRIAQETVRVYESLVK